MEFLDPNYKKRHNRRLFLSYGLVGLLIFIVSGATLLQASGYSITQSGDLKESSLLFVDSDPSNSDVFLNGLDQDVDTEARIVTDSGQYGLTVSKDGYFNWSKNITLDGRTVQSVRYPLLFPINPETTLVSRYSSQVEGYQSPDKRHVLVRQSGSNIFYNMYDIESETASLDRKTVNMSSLIFEQAIPLSTEILDWSLDAQTVLVKATYVNDLNKYWLYSPFGTTERYLIPTTSTKSVRTIEMLDKTNESLYVLYQDGELRRLDTSSSVSDLVAVNVANFSHSGSQRVLFTRVNSGQDGIDVIALDGLDSFKLADLPFDDSLSHHLGLSIFDGDWYYSIGSSSSETLRIYKNPVSALVDNSSASLAPIISLRVNELSQATFSNNSRIISGVHSGGVVAYDIETDSPYRYDVEGHDFSSQAVNWMDGFRMFTKIEDNLYIWDFDNANYITLDQIADSDFVFFDKDNDSFVYLQPGSGPRVNDFQLVRQSLLAE